MFRSKHTAYVEGEVLGHAVRITIEVEAGEVTATDYNDGEPILVDAANIKQVLMSHVSPALKALEATEHEDGIEGLRPKPQQPKILVFPKNPETKH